MKYPYLMPSLPLNTSPAEVALVRANVLKMRHAHELSAMSMYHDNVSRLPRLEQPKAPRWGELGLTMRNAYRNAVTTLLDEYEQAATATFKEEPHA